MPERKCMGCQQMKPKEHLVRIVKTKDNIIQFDPTNKMNGRGAYICMDVECFLKARKLRGLERTLKGKIPDNVYDIMEQQFSLLLKPNDNTNSILSDCLTMCKRAAKLVYGFDLVKNAISKGTVELLLISSDLSDKTKKELVFIATQYDIKPIKMPLTLDELWYLLGKRVGIIAVIDEAFSLKLKTILEENE